jgi:hypothetical protein
MLVAALLAMLFAALVTALFVALFVALFTARAIGERGAGDRKPEYGCDEDSGKCAHLISGTVM